MQRRGERGYNMVMMLLVITFLNLAVAAAWPLWSAAMKREREEELIFRGLQYAEAIRVFQMRQGRLPVRLKELVEVEPRCIRQLWTDPMTDSLNWGLIIESGQGAVPVGGDPPAGLEDKGGAEPTLPGPTAEPPGGPGQPGSQVVGPIKGVYSRSTEESIKMFLGRRRYDQWKFTADLMNSPFGVPGGGRGGGPLPRFKAEWIGRPFRPDIQPPAGAGPGDGAPGGPPGRPPGGGGFGVPGGQPPKGR